MNQKENEYGHSYIVPELFSDWVCARRRADDEERSRSGYTAKIFFCEVVK